MSDARAKQTEHDSKLANPSEQASLHAASHMLPTPQCSADVAQVVLQSASTKPMRERRRRASMVD